MASFWRDQIRGGDGGWYDHHKSLWWKEFVLSSGEDKVSLVTSHEEKVSQADKGCLQNTVKTAFFSLFLSVKVSINNLVLI